MKNLRAKSTLITIIVTGFIIAIFGKKFPYEKKKSLKRNSALKVLSL